MRITKSDIYKLGLLIRDKTKDYFCKHHPGAFSTNYSNFCGLCSYLLYTKLKEKGAKNVKLIKGGYDKPYCGCHCWVEHNFFVYDITCTQFDVNLPEVLITSKNGKFFKNNYKHPQSVEETQLEECFRHWSLYSPVETPCKEILKEIKSY